MVIKPYFFFPEILQYVRNLVQNEQSSSIRRLVFKLIGTLGALDPYLVKQIQLYYNSSDGVEGSDMHSNIPLLRLIDQHVSNPDLSNLAEVQSSVVKHLLRKKGKAEHEQTMRVVSKEGGGNDGVNNQVFKDMPMIIFYTQLGARGQDMIKYLKKYDFQETKENKYPTKAIQHLIKVLLDPTLRDHHHIVL